MNHSDQYMALVVLLGVVAPIIFVVRHYGQPPPASGEWVAWQQAHTAVKMMIKRHALRTVVATSLALYIHSTGWWEYSIVVGIVALDGLIALATSSYAMARLERPSVRIERRGNWLFVEGPRWVHCSAKAWERASTLTAASAGLRRDN
jgi:hypothetical protein